MRYKEYLAALIIESTIDDDTKDALSIIMESANTIEELEYVENYLTEKMGDDDWEPKSKPVKWLKSKCDSYEQRVALPAARKAAGKYADYVDKDEWDIDSSCPEFDAFDDAMNKACDAYNNSMQKFAAGTLATAAVSLLASVTIITAAGKKLCSALRKAKIDNVNDIEAQLVELNEQVKVISDRCKKGEITQKEAEVEAKKIKIKIDKLMKQAKKIMKTAKGSSEKPAKESANIIDLQLEVFDAFEHGNITEEDRDNLLAMLEAAEADEMTLKEQQDASGASTASDDGKANNNEYDLDGYEDAEEKIEKSLKEFEDGNIEKGCQICEEAIDIAIRIYSKAIKTISDDESIRKEIDALKEDVNELKSQCKSGDVTASKAKTLANKIRVKIKLIAKKIKAATHKKGKSTTESVLNAIFEGASCGYLQDDELEFLAMTLGEACLPENVSASDLVTILLEAKNAETEDEKKSTYGKLMTKYYGGLDKVSEKGARRLTPTADKSAAKEGRIANNSDYDAYYQKYSDTKKKIKTGAVTATIGAGSAVLPGPSIPILTPIFVKGAKYSPDPGDAKMVDDAITKLKEKGSSLFKGKKSSDVDEAIVAANTVKTAIKNGTAPEKKDIRIFDTVANKLNAMAKKMNPAHAMEQTQNLDDIRILLEGCMVDPDLDNAIDTMAVVIEAYDFMNDDINDVFTTAETTIDLRLDC